MCSYGHGFVVNRGLFEQYEIPLPTDYDSFISACRAFEAVGLRGFTADYSYDYTCMETLQGLSATALSSGAPLTATPPIRSVWAWMIRCGRGPLSAWSNSSGTYI